MDYKQLEEKLFLINEKEKSNIADKNKKIWTIEDVPFSVILPQVSIQQKKYSISIHNRFKSVPPHTHSICEISYIYHGNVKQWIDGKYYTLSTGDIVVLDKHVPHAIGHTQYEDIMINLHTSESFFSGSFISKFIKDSVIANTFFSVMQSRNENNYLIFHTKDNQLLKQTIQNMLIEHFEPKVGSSEMMQAYMLLYFGELLRSSEYYVDKTYTNTNENIYIAEILSYIENHYIEGSLINAAKELSITSIHLSRLIKKHIGKTYKQLVHEKRISVAYELLMSTNLPIYKIAEKVGYSNLNTFNQKFRNKFHCLPGQINRLR